MRADRGAGGVPSAGGSGNSISLDWNTAVEADSAARAGADEDDVPNTVDYCNGEVGCSVGLWWGRCTSFSLSVFHSSCVCQL